MDTTIVTVKSLILKALSHAEAVDGLFLQNFYTLHEEDERPGIQCPREMLLFALNELIQEGQVIVDEEIESVVFKIAKKESFVSSYFS